MGLVSDLKTFVFCKPYYRGHMMRREKAVMFSE